MNNDDLDKVLAGEAEIVPSSGFVMSVMDAVKREASAPLPIPFPWIRAVPALLAACFALAALIFMFVHALFGMSPIEPMPSESQFWGAMVVRFWRATDATWILVALMGSFAAVKGSTRFVARQK